MQKENLTVATVLKPQGIRGEVKVKVFLDGGENLKGIKTLFIDGAEYPVLSVRPQGEFAYVAFKGIADRTAAESLRGKPVEARRADMPALPPDRYYICDLLGLEVRDEKGTVLGRVEEITPAKTDVYTLLSGEKNIMFAAAEGVITDVDLDGGYILVNGKRFREVSL